MSNATKFVGGTDTRDTLAQVCAGITAAQAGTVVWRRVGESAGSGKGRKAGQFDSRPVTKAWMNANGNGVYYLFVILNGAGGKGEGMRKIRIDSLITASVG